MSTTKQPSGMYVLAFTETFERLSFYTLSFLLVLYASAPKLSGGLGWNKGHALALVSVYSMAAYVLPTVGALIADRLLGRYRAVLLGGVAIIAGHILMLLSGRSEAALYTALCLVAGGTAFLKPCMPALLGRLYKSDDPRRGTGFNWYYAGINLGGFLAGISSGLLAEYYGYHIALGSAALGMIIGLCVFYFGRHHLVFDAVSAHAAQSSGSAHVARRMTVTERNAVYALLIALMFYALWAVCYNLALTGTLSLYIENYTQRTIGSFTIPTTFFSSLNSLVIIVAAPVISMILARRAISKRYPHMFSQMAFGCIVLAISMVYLVYLVHIGQQVHGAGEKPFSWMEIALFMIIYSLSEIIISPTMMAAASVIAPFRFKSTFQALILLLIGLTALISGQLGAISFHSPMPVFSTVAIIVIVMTVIYYLVKGKMIRAAEMEVTQQPKKELTSQQA